MISSINIYVALHGDFFAVWVFDDKTTDIKMERKKSLLVSTPQKVVHLLYFALPFSCLTCACRNEAWEKPIHSCGVLKEGFPTNRWCFLLCFLSSVPSLSFPIVLFPDNITFTLLLPHLPPVTPHEMLPYRALTQNKVHFHLPLCLVKSTQFKSSWTFSAGCKAISLKGTSHGWMDVLFFYLFIPLLGPASPFLQLSWFISEQYSQSLAHQNTEKMSFLTKVSYLIFDVTQHEYIVCM